MITLLSLLIIFLIGVVTIATVSPVSFTVLLLIGSWVILGAKDYNTTVTLLSNTPWTVWLIYFIGFLGHLILGGFYSLHAWREYVSKKKKENNYSKELYKNHTPEWADASCNKDLFYCWIMGWELDLLWKCIKNPVTMVYDYFSSMYDKITKEVLEG